MTDNLAILHKEYDKFVGTLVIDSFKICLFLGIEEHPDDYYYQLVPFKSNHKILSSCVGEIIPMKGFILDESYTSLVRVWNLNNTQEAQ